MIFSFSLNAGYGGTENSIFPTYGETCAELGDCINGVPPAAQFPTSDVSVRNTAVTPRVSLQEQFTPNAMIYATVSKGFRPAGADLQVPEASGGAELTADGYPKQPANYQADYVWNYEVGTKNRLGPVASTAVSTTSAGPTFKRPSTCLPVPMPSRSMPATRTRGR